MGAGLDQWRPCYVTVKLLQQRTVADSSECSSWRFHSSFSAAEGCQGILLHSCDTLWLALVF